MLILNNVHLMRRISDPSCTDPMRLSKAVAASLKTMQSRIGGQGGIIAVLADGSVAVDFTTERMVHYRNVVMQHAPHQLSSRVECCCHGRHGV